MGLVGDAHVGMRFSLALIWARKASKRPRVAENVDQLRRGCLA